MVCGVRAEVKRPPHTSNTLSSRNSSRRISGKTTPTVLVRSLPSLHFLSCTGRVYTLPMHTQCSHENEVFVKGHFTSHTNAHGISHFARNLTPFHRRSGEPHGGGYGTHTNGACTTNAVRYTP